jgi:hypothetical protein
VNGNARLSIISIQFLKIFFRMFSGIEINFCGTLNRYPVMRCQKRSYIQAEKGTLDQFFYICSFCLLVR